jgi:hypothetical protein
MTIANFFDQLLHPLSPSLRDTLEKQGFETAEALLEASTARLREAGLKRGDIHELAAALKKLLHAEARDELG